MSLASLLDSLPIPILQAPMAGASSSQMALDVSRAGGLGSLAAAMLSPDEIGAAVAALKAGTDAPFAVNLLVARPASPGAAELDAALARLAPWYEAAGVPLPAAPNSFSIDFTAQFEAVVRAAPPIASFAFDVVDRDQVDALHRAGSYVVGTANTVAEARAWADVGADGICAQGAEAGGHRGNFLAEIDASLVGTLPLVATIRQAVDLPVIAAGGIMDGAGVAAALQLGASAAQLCTAFIACPETSADEAYRAALLGPQAEHTAMTRVISGRPARGLANRFTALGEGIDPAEVPDYPRAYDAGKALNAAARAAGDTGYGAQWAGQGAPLARSLPAAELMAVLAAELETALRP